MNVLLINPPTSDNISNKEFMLPPSILYLAGSLKAAGHSTSILDLNVHKPWLKEADEQHSYCLGLIEKEMSRCAPGLVGIGCCFSGHFPLVWSYTKSMKTKFPNIPIAIGGIHPTLFYNDILTNCPSIDYVGLGEGEKTIVALADALEKNPSQAATIPGLAFRHEGKAVSNERGTYIENLDEIPFPAYDLVNFKDYFHDTSGWWNPRGLPINATVPILSSRSCPFLCNFCSMFKVMGRGWRYRSVDHVLKEIEYFYHVHNHRHFSFIDDNLTLKKSHILELCNQIVKRNLVFQFETPNGIATSTLDEEVMDALVEAGMTRVSLAIESGSDEIRNKIMKKHLPRQKIYNAVNLTKKHKKLYVRAFFIIGMPEETKETLTETYDMIKDLDVDQPIVFNVMPFPGTALFDQCFRDGLLLNHIEKSSIWKMDTFYLAGNKNFFIKPYKMTMEELLEFREKMDAYIEPMTKRKRTERKMSHYAD
ncbi:MAG: B12-binding domain-containing radical SAM protein [Nitrospinae bacterium]|nr:B12-binding domain-containing radical SAM protein [Nitrospinota bacterium]